jgi:hypothetical protein
MATFSCVTAIRSPPGAPHYAVEVVCPHAKPQRANHVWSYDFAKEMTPDGPAHSGADRRVHAGVLGVAGGTAVGEYPGDRGVGGCQVGARGPEAHRFGQWAGVHCRRAAELVGEAARNPRHLEDGRHAATYVNVPVIDNAVVWAELERR